LQCVDAHEQPERGDVGWGGMIRHAA
jgi:hypothetical protein